MLGMLIRVLWVPAFAGTTVDRDGFVVLHFGCQVQTRLAMLTALGISFCW